MIFPKQNGRMIHFPHPLFSKTKQNKTNQPRSSRSGRRRWPWASSRKTSRRRPNGWRSWRTSSASSLQPPQVARQPAGVRRSTISSSSRRRRQRRRRRWTRWTGTRSGRRWGPCTWPRSSSSSPTTRRTTPTPGALLPRIASHCIAGWACTLASCPVPLDRSIGRSLPSPFPP